jgi:general secretion pathway protein H
MNFFPTKTQAAFTLLELMVVIVIIGIVLTFTTLAIGDGGKQQTVRHEAERFTALLQLASEEAALRGRDLGISLSATQYQFWQLNGQEWQRLDDEMLRVRTLPAGMQLHIAMDGEPVEMPHTLEKVTQPALLLLASGEITPFIIRFAIEESNVAVRGELTGVVTIRDEKN